MAKVAPKDLDYLDDLFDEIEEEAKAEDENKEEAKEEGTEEKKDEKKEETFTKADLDSLKSELSEQYSNEINGLKQTIEALANKDTKATNKEADTLINGVEEARATLAALEKEGLATKGQQDTIQKLIKAVLTLETGGKIKNFTELSSRLEDIDKLGSGMNVLYDAQLGAEFNSVLAELKNDPDNQHNVLPANIFEEKVLKPALNNPKMKNAIVNGMKAQGAKNFLEGMYYEAVGKAASKPEFLKRRQDIVEAIEKRKKAHANHAGDAGVEMKKSESTKKRSVDDVITDAWLSKIGAKTFG